MILRLLSPILFLLSFLIGFQTTAQDLLWARQVSSQSFLEITDCHLAPNGDLYSTGLFSFTTDFDFGDGTAELTPVQLEDQFVLRTDENGDFVSVIQLGGNFSLETLNVMTDGDGNVYVAGEFTGTADFDPSAGASELTADENHAVLAKYDADLNLIWARKVGNADSYTSSSALLVDDNGIYLSGRFEGNLSVNDQVEISGLEPGFRAFLIKFDPSDGSVIRADHFDNNVTIHDMAADANGGLLAVGGFFQSMDADLSDSGIELLESNGSQDVFVTRYDADGGLVNAFNIGNSGSDFALEVEMDNAGNIVVAGAYFSQIDCDPTDSNQNLSTSGSTDGSFLAKYTPDFSLIWQKQIGKASDTYINDMTIDESRAVWFTGHFNETANFDPDNLFSGEDLTAQGERDGYVCRLDADGALLSYGAFTGTWNTENPTAISGNANGEYYVTGNFNLDIDIDPSGDEEIFNSAGSTDSFITRFDGFALNTPAPTERVDLKIYPNPARETFFLSASSTLYGANVKLYNQMGQEVAIEAASFEKGMNISTNASPGIYIAQLIMADGSTSAMKIILE